MSFFKKVMAVLTRSSFESNREESALAREREMQQKARLAQERVKQEVEKEKEQYEEIEVPTEGLVEQTPTTPEEKSQE